MREAYVLAEGQTEERFVKTVLAPHLLAWDLHLQPVIAQTKRIASGRKYQGGITSWRQVERDLRTLLRASHAVTVTTMIDLYALPNDWPGCPVEGHTPHEKAGRIEAAMAAAVTDLRFLPHLTLHEFEAFLFVDPGLCGKYADVPQVEKALRSAVHDCGHPEMVNDGVNTAPSKRLMQAWPGYAKTTDGPALTAEIGLHRLREACPHFDAWVTRLEQL